MLRQIGFNFLPLESARQKVRKNKKIFIFDRDSTLLDKTMNLMLPEQVLPLLSNLSEMGPIGIISRGGFGDETMADPLVHKMIEAGIPFCRELYFGHSTSMLSLFNRKENESVRALANNFFYQLKKNNFIALPNNFSMEVKIGNIAIKLNRDAFAQDGFIYNQGKLVGMLEIMDHLHCKLSYTHYIRLIVNSRLGIDDITFPDNYTELASENILMMDDETSVCKAAETFGFSSIMADTDDKFLSCARDVVYFEDAIHKATNEEALHRHDNKLNRLMETWLCEKEIEEINFISQNSSPQTSTDRDHSLNDGKEEVATEDKKDLNKIKKYLLDKSRQILEIFPKVAPKRYLLKLAILGQSPIPVNQENLNHYTYNVECMLYKKDYKQALLDIQLLLKGHAWHTRCGGGITVTDRHSGFTQTYPNGVYRILVEIKRVLSDKNADDEAYLTALNNIREIVDEKRVPLSFLQSVFKGRDPNTSALYDKLGVIMDHENLKNQNLHESLNQNSNSLL